MWRITEKLELQHQLPIPAISLVREWVTWEGQHVRAQFVPGSDAILCGWTLPVFIPIFRVEIAIEGGNCLSETLGEFQEVGDRLGRY